MRQSDLHEKQARTVQSRRSAMDSHVRCNAWKHRPLCAGRLLLLTLLLFTFLEGARAYETHWSYFDANAFDNEHILTAFVQINGEYVTSDNFTDLEIAAFVGDECRGHAFMANFVEFGDPYPIVELSIYCNNEREEVTF